MELPKIPQSKVDSALFNLLITLLAEVSVLREQVKDISQQKPAMSEEDETALRSHFEQDWTTSFLSKFGE